jgi:hypothetical protein
MADYLTTEDTESFIFQHEVHDGIEGRNLAMPGIVCWHLEPCPDWIFLFLSQILLYIYTTTIAINVKRMIYH